MWREAQALQAGDQGVRQNVESTVREEACYF